MLNRILHTIKIGSLVWEVFSIISFLICLNQLKSAVSLPGVQALDIQSLDSKRFAPSQRATQNFAGACGSFRPVVAYKTVQTSGPSLVDSLIRLQATLRFRPSSKLLALVRPSLDTLVPFKHAMLSMVIEIGWCPSHFPTVNRATTMVAISYHPTANSSSAICKASCSYASSF